MVIEWSVAFIALAFIVLVVYTVLTLRSARASLDQVNQALSQMQQQLNDISKETLELLQQTNRITADVHNKIKSADSLFQSAQQVGEAVHEVVSSVKQVSATVSQSVMNHVQQAVHKNRNTVSEMTEWATIAIRIWQKWQAHKEAKANATQANLSKEGDEKNVQQ